MASTDEPQRTDVDVGTWALGRFGDEERRWYAGEREPGSGEISWDQRDDVAISDTPKRDMHGADYGKTTQGHPIFYVERISMVGTPTRTSTPSEEVPHSSTYVVTIIDTEGEATQIGGSTQKDVLVDAIEYFRTNHEFDRYIDIPFVPGKRNALINHTNEHPDGREMGSWERISGGYYANTQMDASQKMNCLHHIADRLPTVADVKPTKFGAV